MSNWRENLKWDSLNSDPIFIKWYKRGRKNYRTYKKLIRMLIILSTISFVFVLFIEPLVDGNVLFKIFLMTLNLITFTGVFLPLSIQKNITEKDVRKTIDDKKKEDEINEKIKKRATF